jgi:hypothetical protein
MFQPTDPSSGALNCCSFCATAVGVFVFIMLLIIHTTHLISIRHTKKDNTCGIEGRTTFTSFRTIIKMITPIAVVQKAWQFPRISTHLMMAK